MRFDEVKYALLNLFHRKLRSWLTVLSILIGIMAVFALVSFGIGIQHYVDNLATKSGVNKLIIYAKGTGAPGTDPSFYLTKDDVNFVAKINGIDEITALQTQAVQVIHNKEKVYTFLIGIDPKKIDFIQQLSDIDIFSGRHLKEGDIFKVVLGYNFQFDNKFMKKGIKLGDKIELNGEEFDVVGFYGEVGDPQDDSQIYVTFDAFNRLYPKNENRYGYIMASSSPGVNTEDLANKIDDKLRKFKGQDKGKEDFYVQTFADALQTFTTIINVLNGVLILIALISLIVASVNIMNTMYTAVLERTNEIGVMKAIGARNSDIGFVFVFESGLLGMIGGIMGVMFGYVIAKIGGSIAAGYGYSLLKPYFPWYLIFGCIMFAFLVGALSGVLPAIQASRQKPVDALRYE